MNDPGDDSVIGRYYLQWVETLGAVAASSHGTPPVAHVYRRPDGVWQMALALDRGTLRQMVVVDVDPFATHEKRTPLIQLGKRAWDGPVAVHVRGRIHAFLTLLNVPHPAPWAPKEIPR